MDGMRHPNWLQPGTEGFGLDNLPLGRCRNHGYVIRIEDHAIATDDLSSAEILEWLDPLVPLTTAQVQAARSAARAYLEEPRQLLPIAEIELLTPMPVKAFADFYSGINHASNVGRMFRPEMPPLLPNYRHLPVAYNGRASTVVPSGTAITRPNGITKPAGEVPPIFGPTQELDFELELGFYVGRSTALGEVVPISEADSSIAGVVLVNDWSSRDVQRFEYQPLGPFLAKSFATSISPWLVTLDALEPFRIQGPAQEPAVLPHLAIDGPQHYDLKLEVALVVDSVEHVVCRTTSAELYWSFAQQFAHQSSNGTALESGDLYATGTISGTEPGTFGSLLELTVRGSQPIAVGDQTRTFLQDGDEVVLRGYGSKDGHFISLGEVRGVVVPS